MRYYTSDGSEVTRDEIKAAVDAGLAVIRWQHGEWRNVASLIISKDADEAELAAEVDTIGECWSMADEQWSELATHHGRAIKAACGQLVTT